MTDVQLKPQKTSTIAVKPRRKVCREKREQRRRLVVCFEEDPVVGVVLDSAADSELVATAATWDSATGEDAEPAGLESWKASVTTGYFSKNKITVSVMQVTHL